MATKSKAKKTKKPKRRQGWKKHLTADNVISFLGQVLVPIAVAFITAKLSQPPPDYGDFQ